LKKGNRERREDGEEFDNVSRKRKSSAQTNTKVTNTRNESEGGKALSRDGQSQI